MYQDIKKLTIMEFCMLIEGNINILCGRPDEVFELCIGVLTFKSTNLQM
jgi:hypothetical protein